MVNWCPILIKPKLKVSWAVGGNLSFRMRLHKDSIFWRRPRAWCTTKMVKSNIEDWWQSWTSASSYLENNASKLHDNSDWESCQSKCITILVKFSGWIFQSVYAEKSKKKKRKTGGLQFTFVVFVFTWHTIHSCSKSKSTIWLFLSAVVCFLLMWRKTLCCSSCNWLIIFYSSNTNPLPPVGVVVTTSRMCLTAGWDCKGAYDIIVSKIKFLKKRSFWQFLLLHKGRGGIFIPSPPGTRFQKCAVLVSAASCKRKDETIENLTIFSETHLCANGVKIKVPFASFLPLFTGLLCPSVTHLFLIMCIWTLHYCQSCCSSAFSVLSQWESS